MTFCASGGAYQPHYTYVDLELTIAAKNLLAHEEHPELDLLCVISNYPFGRDWQEYARTEVAHNSSEPHFNCKTKFKYCLGERQRLKFELYGTSDISNRSLSKLDYLGRVKCNLGQIVAARQFEAPLVLDENSSDQGQLIIIANEVCKNHEELELTFSTSKFKKHGLPMLHPDPFLEIVNSHHAIRSRCLTNTKHPEWPHLSLPLRALKNDRGEYAQVILRCYNYKEEEEHQFLSEVEIPSKHLLHAPASFALKKHGEVHLSKSILTPTHSFVEYMASGVQLHCIFGIDLNASNGDPRSPESHHYLGPQPNHYESLMRAFGEIIQDYNTDEVLSLLCFGARSIPISHELRVNGVNSVLQGYRNCLETVTLGESRNFVPPIEHVVRTAKPHADRGDSYFILIIMTDGDITDVRPLAKAMIDASEVPMSIVFVGIGTADFPVLTLLNSDKRKLGLDGHDDIRDVGRFVSFQDFLSTRDIKGATFNLVKHVLSDVPQQLTTFMKLNSFSPKNITRSNSNNSSLN